MGVPQNGWFTMENPIFKMDDLGIPLFQETSILTSKLPLQWGNWCSKPWSDWDENGLNMAELLQFLIGTRLMSNI
jgi:hypothetical protein